LRSRASVFDEDNFMPRRAETSATTSTSIDR
jgi:hypothetical protein